MRKVFLLSKSIFINIFLLLSLSSLLIYLIVSMNTITVWYGKYTNLNEKYINLQNQEQDLEQQISKLKIKVEGIKQETLSKDILTKQIRERLGIYSKNEIILKR